MSDNDNAMSCDPANPRRSQVPGPASVKFVTEDLSGVGDQAPVLVNAPGSSSSSSSKKLVQQAFHPGLFMRPRSSSLGSNKQIEARPTSSNQPLTYDTETETTSICPPIWQRVPISRNPKRKKISNSPETVKTSNSFDGLSIDLTEPNDIPKDKQPPKPPPIVLYGIEDVNKLTELIETVVDKNQFTFKIVNRSQLRISCLEIESYKQIMKLVRENGLIGHTFNRKDQRCFRVVIRNLHPTTPMSAIKEDIEATGNIITGEIINAKYGPDKKPTSTFFVNLAPGPNNKRVKELKYIYHQSVIIEDPKKQKSIVQCQRCQQYGHSKNYCMRPYRCVKCGQSHKTSECPKRDRTTPAQCALCNGPHPANYKGCEVYREILLRRSKSTYQVARNSQTKIFSNDKTEDGSVPNISVKTVENPEDTIKYNLYSDATRNKKHPALEKTNPQPFLNLEQIIIKQTEKFDLIIQQMSTLMMLITQLVDKLSK